MDMTIRPRRLRNGVRLRKMVRETRMDPSSLIYPMFVKEGDVAAEEIPTMPGQYRYSLDGMERQLDALLDAGVNSVMLFGIPDHKDEMGSGAWDENGIIQKALRRISTPAEAIMATTAGRSEPRTLCNTAILRYFR